MSKCQGFVELRQGHKTLLRTSTSSGKVVVTDGSGAIVPPLTDIGVVQLGAPLSGQHQGFVTSTVRVCLRGANGKLNWIKDNLDGTMTAYFPDLYASPVTISVKPHRGGDRSGENNLSRQGAVQAQATAEPDDRLDSFGQIVYAYISANPGPENFSDPSFALTPVRVHDTDIDYEDDCEDADGSESGAGSTDTLRANVLSSASRNIVGDGDNDQDDFPPCTQAQILDFIGTLGLELATAVRTLLVCPAALVPPLTPVCLVSIAILVFQSFKFAAALQQFHCQLPLGGLGGQSECGFGVICN
ncbi:MAG: hypothetical protein ACREM8_05190 [Vulcanimicrobiaceae bacterium]